MSVVSSSPLPKCRPTGPVRCLGQGARCAPAPLVGPRLAALGSGQWLGGRPLGALPARGTTRGARGAAAPQALFGGLFGGGQSAAAPEAPPTLDAADLPFPDDLLDGTFLAGKPLAEAYAASRDGWSATDFHAKCDLKGPCVMVAETTKGVRFGGFTPVGWASTDDYRDNPKAFLFRWMSPRDAEPIILPVLGGGQAAVFDFALGGPQWGADGLVVGGALAPSYGGMAGPDSDAAGAGDLRTAKSRLGLSYAALPDGGKSLLGAKEATLREVRVFYAPEIAALY